MAIEKKQVSPRQKMINLIYVVLMAMLAINVSPEVLDGYGLIQESLLHAIESSSSQNESIYRNLNKEMQLNPIKAGLWYEKAQQIRSESDSLYLYIELLKQEIEQEADGSRESVDPVNKVMFSPITRKGQELSRLIDSYCHRLQSLEGEKSTVSKDILSTASDGLVSWHTKLFEDKPSVVAIALLTKLQSDIRYAESMTLHGLLDGIDRTDVNVNTLTALVIPESRTVIRGSSYKADIVLAAVDSTDVPSVYLQDATGKAQILSENRVERYHAQSGEFKLSGYIVSKNKVGDTIRSYFSQPYSVIEPSATVSAELTNVLYAGYDNPVSVSCPGLRAEEIYASMENATVREVEKGRYIVRPLSVSQSATMKVFARKQDGEQLMASYDFKVRSLPEPMPYIQVPGNRFRGGRISRQDLLAVSRLSAAIDDGILDVTFRVTGFDLVAFDAMGNAVPATSDGPGFSTSQKDAISRMPRGQRFFLTHVKAVGPDGRERQINSSMEIIIK